MALPDVADLDAGRRANLHRTLTEAVERELIGGPPFELPAHGIARPDKQIAQNWARARNERQAEFVKWGVNGDRAWRVAIGAEYVDILDMLIGPLSRAGVELSELCDQGAEAMTEFLSAIPTPYAMACLDAAAICNQGFSWEANDFHDLILMSSASVYCDVIVGETKWVNLLHASRARPQATVTKDLADLPILLVEATRAEAS
ncbi:MAG: hypothetical protein WD598_08180 [Acidimicrobiia bacterium]